MEQQVRGLAAELLLQNELAGLRREIDRLDGRCEFLASVHGARSRQYRDAATERDSLLLQADQIITQWAEKHVSVATAKA
jgi:hypothetical protein